MSYELPTFFQMLCYFELYSLPNDVGPELLKGVILIGQFRLKSEIVFVLNSIDRQRKHEKVCTERNYFVALKIRKSYKEHRILKGSKRV